MLACCCAAVAAATATPGSANRRSGLSLQVMQADADAKAGKAIERYMRMAFNDATGEPTADSNPLLRRNHKLSATNPLL